MFYPMSSKKNSLLSATLMHTAAPWCTPETDQLLKCLHGNLLSRLPRRGLRLGILQNAVGKTGPDCYSNFVGSLLFFKINSNFC